MIKYLGSKRRLVPVLGDICARLEARTALDLFTGTTRVAQEFKRRGAHVTAVDTARYAELFAQCYVATDADAVDQSTVVDALRDLASRRDVDGYVTETFCRQSRFFQPHNGMRIDAIREATETDYSGSPLYPVLLTSLIEAADRVDSTTGVQMAYVKQWAPRSFNPLELRPPGGEPQVNARRIALSDGGKQSVLNLPPAGGDPDALHSAAGDDPTRLMLELADNVVPDAIILDMRMPITNGLQFLRLIRSKPHLVEVPVAIVTGDYFLADAIQNELRSLGASIRFKPMYLEDLLTLARTMVA